MGKSIVRSDRVKHAEVGPAGALICIEQTLELETGRAHYTIEGLPSTADGHSIRLSTTHGKIVSVRTSWADQIEPASPPHDPRARAAALGAEMEFLETLRPDPEPLASDALQPNAFFAAMDRLTEHRRNVAQSIVQVEAMEPRSSQRRKTLTVEIESNHAVTCTLSLFCEVRAGWEPIHELTFSPESGLVSIESSVEIWQRSGIDWKDTSVDVVRKTPNALVAIAELEPWKLDEEDVAPSSFVDDGAPTVDIDAAQESTDLEHETIRPSEATVTLQAAPRMQSNLVHQMNVDCASGTGTGAKFVTTTVERKAQLSYVVDGDAPSTALACLTLEAFDAPESVPIRVVVGDLECPGAVRPGPTLGTVRVWLGKPVALSVNRLVDVQVARPETLGAEQVWRVGVELTVENTTQHALRAFIVDRIPLAKSDGLIVRLLRTIPREAELDGLHGTVTFSADLARGAQTTFSFVYEIVGPTSLDAMSLIREEPHD